MTDISKIFNLAELDRLEKRCRYYIKRARYGSATSEGQAELEKQAAHAKVRLTEISVQKRRVRR